MNVLGRMALGLETALRLPRRYDVAKLREDLASLRRFPARSFDPSIRRGEWAGVSLYAQRGRFDALHSGSEPYEPTEALACAPYLRALLDELDAPKLSVRVLSLGPDARIFEHYDCDSSLDLGVVRLHVPIVTHELVQFTLAGRRLRWHPGELCYGDFSFPHAAHNRSTVTRVHLVMDLGVTDAIRALFPIEYTRATELRAVYRAALQAVCDHKTRAKEHLGRLLHR